MIRTTIAVVFSLCVLSRLASAQPNSPATMMHVGGLVIDGGNGINYSIYVPPMQSSINYTLPNIPPNAPTAGYVGEGLLIGQTLYWNGSMWMASSALSNNGTDLIASGSLSALNFIGSGAGLTSLPASQLTGFVPLANLSGITSAQLATNAGIVDAQIVSISGSKITGSLPSLDGSSITNISAANIAPGTAPISISGNAATATTATNLSGAITEGQVTNLTNDLSAKANDAQVVHLSGTETIAGAKTFTSAINANLNGNANSASSLSSPISETQVTNLTSDLTAKANDASVVHQTGAESIAGVKTFTSTIQGNISGTAGSATNFTGNIPESQVTNLTTDLAAKAIDAAVVHQSGAESIAGVKTFTSTIQGNISGTAGTATNFSGNIAESQVTNLTGDLAAKAIDASVVHQTGAESIAGVKTFTSTIQGNISGTAGSATSFSGNISESQVTNLTTDLSAKATDASVVHQTGAESIAGVKTFTSTIQGNISGTAGSAATISGNIPESQVTNLTSDLAAKATDASVVHQTGAESIAGVKTFTSTIQGDISGTAGSATIFTGNVTESQVTNLTSDLSAKATDASVVHQTGAESIGGVKTFTSTIQGNISGNAGSATTISGNITESQVTSLATDLAAKAVDASVVHQTGAESIGGVKTFTSTIQGSVSGNAANVTGVVAVANGGTGTSTGSITPTGNYAITQNNVAVLTSESASAAANTLYLKQGNVGVGQVPTAKLDVNGTAQMTGFKLPTGAALNYVLTSDANGVGTWQAASGGSGGSLSGGTSNYVPLWSSASTQTSSIIYQSSGQLGIGNTLPGATLDVTGTGKFSGLLTANGGVTLGGTLTLGGNSIAADTGKSVGKYVLATVDINHGYIDVSCANVTTSSEVFICPRKPTGLAVNTRPTMFAAVGAINTANHTFRVDFFGADFAVGDIINWWVIN